jgi:hypothetical protein
MKRYKNVKNILARAVLYGNIYFGDSNAHATVNDARSATSQSHSNRVSGGLRTTAV